MTQLTQFLKIRVSRDQYERILNNMRAKNYKTISEYGREIIIGKGLFVEKLVVENNKILKEILEIIKNKDQPK